jgi:hypothetical protein
VASCTNTTPLHLQSHLIWVGRVSSPPDGTMLPRQHTKCRDKAVDNKAAGDKATEEIAVAADNNTAVDNNIAHKVAMHKAAEDKVMADKAADEAAVPAGNEAVVAADNKAAMAVNNNEERRRRQRARQVG